MSNAPIYEPVAGSLPARAIERLRKHPPGTIIRTPDLARGLGVPTQSIQSSLATAVKHGLLRRKMCEPQEGKRATFGYSLPIGDAFDQDEANGGKPLQRVVPATQAPAPTAGVPSVFQLADHMGPGALPFDLVGDAPATPPETTGLNWKPGKPLKAATPAANLKSFEEAEQIAALVQAVAPLMPAPPGPSAPPLDCALWSNGELWLRIDGAEPLVLNKAQTETLIHYLDRLATELSPTTTTTTRKASMKSLAIGAAHEGGFFGGIVRINDLPHGVIWAPKAEGQMRGKWLDSYTAVPGARSCFDSLVNTLAMAEAGSPIAKWALGLDINGKTDWCVPARDVLELGYRHLKPANRDNSASFRDGDNASSVPVGYPYIKELPAQTEVAAFKTGGVEAFDEDWYWSSTQYSADYAFLQGFYYGLQDYSDKKALGSVRAVRLIQLGT